ncbi:MAG: DUF1015 domain-containing protein [Acidimicrobiales bacterium]
MPVFQPFKGVRYSSAAVHVDQVIAPPYDVISSAERVRLASRHPANSVLLELPEPDLPAALDRYQVASKLLETWLSDGTLITDERPSLYTYKMTSPNGSASTGIIGALGIEPAGSNDVLPHEETLPKPKSDRLDLLRSTCANLSPIWGLSLSGGLSKTFEPTTPATSEAFDDDGVLHQLWVVSDEAQIKEISESVASSPVVIADGHHRYETAQAYRREMRAMNADAPGDYDYVMALIVELSDEQLCVGAIHRTVAGLPPDFDFLKVFDKYFEIIRAGFNDARTVGALVDSGSMALVLQRDAYLLTPRPVAYEAANSDLDSSLVAVTLNDLPAHTSTHRHTANEAIEAVNRGEAQAAVLLRPATVEQIANWARDRRKMPPKTTFFSPKPRTGMVFRVLQDPFESLS